MDYKQPDFYHFSEDSLLLVNCAKKNLSGDERSLLDIGSGCGVLAIECANRINSISKIDLIEPQKEFFEFLDYNLKNILIRNVKFRIIKIFFSTFDSDQKYDLIICNPPYFDKGAGRISPNLQKQICRTFEFDSAELYVKKILSLLNDTGKAFVLIPHNVQSWDSVLGKYKDRLKEIERLNRVSIYLLC